MATGEGGGTVVYAFEAIDESLTYMPLAVRRVLDASGRDLRSRAGALAIDERWSAARAGAQAHVAVGALDAIDRAIRSRADHARPRTEPCLATAGARIEPLVTRARSTSRHGRP